MKKIEIDEGYFFGMGVFETIAVESGTPVFLKEHLQRMRKGLEVLQITSSPFENLTEQDILQKCKTLPFERGVLKICVSNQNMFFQTRENFYHVEQYQTGFSVKLASVRRNETSPFTYIKSLNCGDNILTKRLIAKEGADEAIFLNTEGKLAEGAVSNIFFIKGEKIYTPTVGSGILPGVMRDYIIKTYSVIEKEIKLDEIAAYDEMFLTNSLMGIMPVRMFENYAFATMECGQKLAREYFNKFTSFKI